MIYTNTSRHACFSFLPFLFFNLFSSENNRKVVMSNPTPFLVLYPNNPLCHHVITQGYPKNRPLWWVCPKHLTEWYHPCPHPSYENEKEKVIDFQSILLVCLPVPSRFGRGDVVKGGRGNRPAVHPSHPYRMDSMNPTLCSQAQIVIQSHS